MPSIGRGIAGFGKAAGSMIAANASASAMRANARAAALEAGDAIRWSAAESARRGEISRRFQSSQRAAVGASGILLEGSALEVQLQAIDDAEMDRINIEEQGRNIARSKRAEAASLRSQAKSTKTAGIFQAAGSLFGAFS